MTRTHNSIPSKQPGAMPFVPTNRELREELKAHWTQLTEHDLRAIELDPSQVVPRLQVAYGFSREEAEEASRVFRGKYVEEDFDGPEYNPEDVV